MIRYYKAVISKYLRNGVWWFYIPLLVFYIYILIRTTLSYEYENMLLGQAALFLHEAGHALFMFGGTVSHYAGGTLFEYLFPTIVFLYFFFWRKDFIAAMFPLVWMGSSMLGTALYIDDADCICMSYAVPITSGARVFDPSNHDWLFLLSKTNILHLNYEIAVGVRTLGYILLWVGTFVTAILMIAMARSSKKQEEIRQEELAAPSPYDPLNPVIPKERM